MKRYTVTRTETILYQHDFTEAELVEMGVPAEVFTDGDLTADFMDAVSARDFALSFALEDATERYADVQGSDFRIQTAR